MLLKDLVYACDVMETGKLSESAERLFITQPALSQAIRRLEDELQIQLFTRSKEGMTPTREGVLFAEYASDIITRCGQLKEQVTRNHTREESRLRVGVVKLYAPILQEKYINPFRAMNPDINVEIVLNRSASLETQLLNGSLDVCIEGTPLDSNLLSFTPLFCEELLLALPKNHPANVREQGQQLSEIDIHQFLEETLYIPKEGNRLHRVFLNMCSLLGFWPNRFVEIESLDTIFDFIRNDNKIAIVSSLYAQDEDHRDMANYYRIQNASSKRLFVAAYLSEKKMPVLLRRFLNFVASNP